MEAEPLVAHSSRSTNAGQGLPGSLPTFNRRLVINNDQRSNWTWILPALICIGLLIWTFVCYKGLPVNPTPTNLTLIPSSSDNREHLYINFVSGKLKAAGIESRLVSLPTSLDTVANFRREDLKVLLLKEVLIDAPSLSKSLEGCVNLRKIIMEKVSVTGEFQRVYLPSLKEFYYNQHRNEDMDNYKQPEKLKNVLFFDINPNSGWELRDLLTMNMNVSVGVGGTEILEVNPGTGAINLNVHDCQGILQASQNWYRWLSLSWCNITSTAISPEVKFLNLNNAISDSGELTRIIGKAEKLEELHLLVPFLNQTEANFSKEQIWLNITDLPPTIQTVSVSKFQILGLPQPSTVKNLAMEQCNVTGILEDFPQIFPQLERFALLELVETNAAYALLNHALNMPGVTWILMEHFFRSPDNPEEDGIETLLGEIGVPELANNFIIEITRSGNGTRTLKGRMVTDFERNYFRFTLFAFNTIDSYDDYLIWDSKTISGLDNIGPVV